MDIELEHLVLRMKESDHNAFNTFYHKLYHSINDFIFYKTKNDALSKDISQETFKKLWINRASLDPKRSIKSYLLKIANNLLIDHYRKKSSNELSLEETDQITDPSAFDPDSSEKVDHIYSLLGLLPNHLSEVFLLSRLEGLKYKEISEIYNISPKTVESWVAKVMLHLKKHLFIIIYMILTKLF